LMINLRKDYAAEPGCYGVRSVAGRELSAITRAFAWSAPYS
jgi:hypothetical protein